KMKRILKRKSLRDYALFTLGINSALRISDLLALTVGDVADENGKIRDRIVIRERKTGKRKAFPISARAKKALTEYLRDRGACIRRNRFSSRGRAERRSLDTPPIKLSARRRRKRALSIRCRLIRCVRASATGRTRAGTISR